MAIRCREGVGGPNRHLADSGSRSRRPRQPGCRVSAGRAAPGGSPGELGIRNSEFPPAHPVIRFRIQDSNPVFSNSFRQKILHLTSCILDLAFWIRACGIAVHWAGGGDNGKLPGRFGARDGTAGVRRFFAPFPGLPQASEPRADDDSGVRARQTSSRNPVGVRWISTISRPSRPAIGGLSRIEGAVRVLRHTIQLRRAGRI